MKYTKLAFIALFMISLTASCDFSEENIGEDTITKASAEELFNPIITQIAYNQSNLTAWTTALFMQYFIQEYAHNESFANYFLPHNATDRLWEHGFYGGSLAGIQELQKISDTDKNTDLQAIALILEINEYLHVTALYGDIPYSEALQGHELKLPKYDSQESVYESLLSKADEAISLIGDNTVNSSLTKIDIIYNGEMARWKQYAYALKARMYLHLTSKSAENYTNVLEAIEQSFTSLNEQANFTWTHHNAIENPLHEFNLQRPATNTIHENFALALMERNDPRMEFITYWNEDTNYWAYQQFSPYILHWSASNTTLPLFSYVELQFMKAEALLMTGAPDEEVSNALRKGIEASCRHYNLTSDSYLDFVDIQSSLEGLENQDEKLAHIISEAYFSYYGFAYQQTWNNYKRLGLPELVLDGTVSEINPTGSLPQRYLYPEIELKLNTENVNEAMERQNGALLDEPLWIFK